MRRERGFTLIELMITIGLLAIVTTLALPSFVQFIQNNRLSGETNELVTAFQYARSEALKRADPVTVCASSNGTSCGGGWRQGWIVLANEGAGDEELLRAWTAPGDDFQFDPAGGSVDFEPSGFASADLTIELDLNNCTGENARRVLIERSGRVGSERFDCT